MARKAAKPKLDADGYVRTGIYQRNVKPITDPGEIEAYVEGQMRNLGAPVESKLAEIRNWLQSIIEPWMEGPLTEAESLKPVGRSCHKFNFGRGEKIYRDKPELDDQQQSVVDGVSDAIRAWCTIRVIELHLKPGGNINWLFQECFRLGQLCERMQIRPFEPLAAAGKRSCIDRPRSAKAGRQKQAAIDRGKRKKDADKALQDAAHRFPQHADNEKTLTKKAAESLGVCVRTFHRWQGKK